MKYWIYHRSRVIGPFAPEKLSAIPTFASASLVCPEESTGLSEKDWIHAGEIPELVETLSRRPKEPSRTPSAYWVLIEGTILGPYPKMQLWSVPGVDLTTIVCPQGADGAESSDWKRIIECPELLEPSLGRSPSNPKVAPSSAVSPAPGAVGIIGAPSPAIEGLVAKQRLLEERLAKLETRSAEPAPSSEAPAAAVEGMGMSFGGDSGGLSLGGSDEGLGGGLGGSLGGGDFSLGGGLGLGGDLGGGLSLGGPSEPMAPPQPMPEPGPKPALPSMPTFAPLPVPVSPPPAPPPAAAVAPAPAPVPAPEKPVAEEAPEEEPAVEAPRRRWPVVVSAAIFCLAAGGIWRRQARAPKPAPAPVPAATPAPKAAAQPAPVPVPAPDPKTSLIEKLRAYAPGSDGQPLEKLLQSSLTAPDRNPAAAAARWTCTAVADGGGDVQFRSDRLDPESGGSLVYQFRMDKGGRVTGQNLPARAILREP